MSDAVSYMSDVTTAQNILNAIPGMIATVNSLFDRLGGIVREKGGDQCAALCDPAIAAAKGCLVNQLEKVKLDGVRIMERGALASRRNLEIQAVLELLAAEMIFTTDEVQRLSEEERQLEQDTKRQHIRNAVTKCASDYRQLNEQVIFAHIKAGCTAVQEIKEEIKAISKEAAAFKEFCEGFERIAEEACLHLGKQLGQIILDAAAGTLE
ncbi:hypothetical protein PENSPDRAFT_650225 [Peniophora sp. CONT]|nr:hypothetical protein PENSPDRAFT_650225 [Peniophora sp. CONT]